METCIECGTEATMECACSALLCEDHATAHTRKGEDHSVEIIKAYIISGVQKNASKNIFNQFKILDDCCIEITSRVNILFQEITRLAEESLQKLQKKRIKLLNYLKITSKKISDKELSELQAISQIVLVNKTACIDPVQDELIQYFKAASFKKC